MRTVLLAAILVTSSSQGAPLPKARPKPLIPQVLTVQYLTGNWTMYWGDTRYPITLEKSGKCTCYFGAVKYVGSWGLDWEGRFWITESSQVGSWQNYAVRIKPGTLAGKIEVGAPGVSFRLEKRK